VLARAGLERIVFIELMWLTLHFYAHSSFRATLCATIRDSAV